MEEPDAPDFLKRDRFCCGSYAVSRKTLRKFLNGKLFRIGGNAMNILMLPSWYRDEAHPNAGSFFLEQAGALVKAGHRVDLLFCRDDAKGKAYAETNMVNGVHEHLVHYKKRSMRVDTLTTAWHIARFILTRKGNEKIDLIHVQSYPAMRYVLLFRRLVRLPTVITEHLSLFGRNLLSPRQLRKTSRCFSRADEVYAVSEGLKSYIQRLCKTPVQVIPNTVSSIFFARPLPERKNGTFTFISIGTLNQNKAFDLLLAAFQKGFQGRRDVRLVICGQGPEREALEALSKHLGIDTQVEFKGEISREACVDTLMNGHAFVLPSRYETFGVVYCEAMACGLPIIMTETSAYRSLVAPETGYAVPIDDVDALRSKMLSLFENYDSFDAARIRAFCRERFSEQALARQLTARYKAVLDMRQERKQQ